jgi:peptidoglycan/LPS O-acetylase OafA/YrhL
MQTLEHRKQIDGLRFFAFLSVFMIHSDVEHFWWGSYGVSLFFVISGFLITRILIASQDRPRGQALKAFYARRALRIFPAYYLVLGLAAATVGIAYLPAFVLYVMNWGAFVYTWIQPALADAPWDPVRMYGIHFWSLAVEEQFYLCWPLVVWATNRIQLRKICMTLLILSPLLRLALWFARPDVPNAGYNFTLSHCDSLALGALLAILAREEGGLQRFSRWAPRVAALSLAVVAMIILATGKFRPPFFWSMTLGLVAATWLGGAIVVMTLMAAPDKPAMRFLSHPWTTAIGGWSYAIYVLHTPIRVVLDELEILTFSDFQGWVPGRLAPQLAFTAVRIGIVITAGALSWHLIEKHFLKLKRHFPYDFAPRAAPAAKASDTASQST